MGVADLLGTPLFICHGPTPPVPTRNLSKCKASSQSLKMPESCLEGFDDLKRLEDEGKLMDALKRQPEAGWA